jgi:signal transduction histidine kinase
MKAFEQLHNRMMAFAAMILAPRNIMYELVADEELKSIQLTSQQRKNIFLIFKEALYNVVKYANCKNVHVVITRQKNGLAMIIQDNGQGFDANRAFADGMPSKGEYLGGNGIKNMKTRADDMNAALHIDSKINEGTIIRLTVSQPNPET